MALNAFQFTGGGNVSVSPTPLAVQVTGPTIVITNIGIVTVFGSLGGSGSSTPINPVTYISGQGVGGTGGGNTATGTGGIAIAPQQEVTLSVGANSWLWLVTLAGNGAVNVANGT